MGGRIFIRYKALLAFTTLCDLEAIAHQLNSPHLFVTWSAADIQWDDLHRHLPKYTEPLDFVSDPNRHQIASHHVIKNPHIVAEYLVRRVSFFMKHIVKNLFKVADFWYRFEWQSRGSGHVHGFICLEDQPPPSTKTEKSREKFAKYWASMVSPINPHQSLPQLGVNPESLPISEQKNTLRDLSECLNRFQRYQHCTPSYCLKKKKGTTFFIVDFTFHENIAQKLSLVEMKIRYTGSFYQLAMIRC